MTACFSIRLLGISFSLHDLCWHHACICVHLKKTCLMTTGRQCFTNDVGVPLMSYYCVLGIQCNPSSSDMRHQSQGLIFPHARSSALAVNPCTHVRLTSESMVSTNGNFSHSPPCRGRACFQLAANQSYMLSYIIIIINRFELVKLGVLKNNR